MNGRPRLLLTGSSGRVGTAIASELETDHEIAGLDVAAGPFTTHLGSITDADLVDRAISGASAIVHTAALHAPQLGRESASRFRQVNVEGTRVLLQAASRHGIERFVYTSSTSIYGHALEPVNEAVWVTEELRPVPRDIYDETKLAAEELLRAAASRRLTCTSLRIARCFPEPDEVVATHRLHRGVDLRDVAAGHRLALGRCSGDYEVFNIAARSPFRHQDCAALLHDARPVLRRYFPAIEETYRRRGWTLPTSLDRVYVIDKAEAVLGFAPSFNFDVLVPTAGIDAISGATRG